MSVQKKYLLTAAILSAPFLALVGVVLQSAALFTEYEGGYFAATAPLHLTVCWFLFAALLVFIALAIIFRREISSPTYTGSLTVFFSSAFMIVTLLCYAMTGIFSVPKADKYTAVFLVLAALTAVGSAVYFALFLTATSPVNARRAILGLAPAFLPLFAAMILYFDKTEQINHPVKLLSMLAFLAVACHALGECRGLFGRQSPALHFVVTGMALLLGTVASIPNILYTLAEGKELVLSTVNDFLLFSYSLYLLARLLQMLPYDLPITHRMVRGFLNKMEEAETETTPEEPAEEAEPEQISVLSPDENGTNG